MSIESEIAVDEASLLVSVPAAKTLSSLEAALGSRGFTLGVAIGDAGSSTVGDWLAKGAPGAASVFSDPADHLVAGLEATLPGGKRLEVRPTPRRAVGPDLIALAVGTHRTLATVDRAWLRIHRRGAKRPSMPLPAGVDLDPPVTEAEARLVAAVQRELGGT
jgi:alkyldihydroxyacetonephosphate synthase